MRFGTEALCRRRTLRILCRVLRLQSLDLPPWGCGRSMRGRITSISLPRGLPVKQNLADVPLPHHVGEQDCIPRAEPAPEPVEGSAGPGIICLRSGRPRLNLLPCVPASPTGCCTRPRSARSWVCSCWRSCRQGIGISTNLASFPRPGHNTRMPPSTELCFRCRRPAEPPAVGQQRFLGVRLCLACRELLRKDLQAFCQGLRTKRYGRR